MKIEYILDFSALIIQVIASVLMFYNSPDNKPDGAYIGATSDVITPKRKNKIVRYSFLALFVGFVLQLISMILKYSNEQIPAY